MHLPSERFVPTKEYVDALKSALEQQGPITEEIRARYHTRVKEILCDPQRRMTLDQIKRDVALILNPPFTLDWDNLS